MYFSYIFHQSGVAAPLLVLTIRVSTPPSSNALPLLGA